MTTVGMDYRVLPGKERVFEDAFRSVLKALEGAAGHRRSRLYREVEAPAVYLILSEWDEPEAFKAFIESDRFRRITDWGLDQVLASRPVHTVYGS
jgi:heme-degrading monooxygenase HmoA